MNSRDESLSRAAAAASSGPRIFMNHRRDDSGPSASRLYEVLASRFGAEHVLTGVDAFDVGVDVGEAIERTVASCDVFLVVIGRTWIDDGSGRRRLAEPEDSVRREIEAALAGDIRVIPVLVDGASMPAEDDLPSSLQELTRRNALALEQTHWKRGLDALLGLVERATLAGSFTRGGAGDDPVGTSPAAVGTLRMQLLDTLRIPYGLEERVIELYSGDLTAMSPEDGVDVLVVSAFPNSYVTTPGTLIAALAAKGVLVGALAEDKAADLRDTCACWMSRELKPADPGLQFRRILCFEPHTRGAPAEVVGDIFRSLIPFLDRRDISSVAMPLVSAGAVGTPVEEILPPLLDAAVHWMSLGIPLERLKIVVRAGHQQAASEMLFRRFKTNFGHALVGAKPAPRYDVFISYAREDEHETRYLVDELSRADSRLRLFVDRRELKPGSSWQQELFDALDASRKVLAVYSPAYVRSKVCKEEFNIAWARSREVEEDVLFPLYLYTADLPTYMKVVQFVDCREGRRDLISAACVALAAAVEGELPAT